MTAKEELIWRIEAAGMSTLDTKPKFNKFADIAASLVPPGAEFIPDLDGCWTDPTDGSSIQLTGWFKLDGKLIGKVERAIHVDSGRAEHLQLLIEEEERNQGYAPLCLWQTLQLYDEIEMTEIILEAGLTSGKHYWAKCGFDFREEDEREFIQEWVSEIVERLGHKDLAGSLRSAAALSAVGSSNHAKASLRDVEKAVVEADFGDHDFLCSRCPGAFYELDVALVARANNIDADEPIEIGKAAFLLIPFDWLAYMSLDPGGPQRQVFEAYLNRRLREITA